MLESEKRYGMVMSEKEKEAFETLRPKTRQLDDLVHWYIQNVFITTGFNRKVTAHLLGISRHALARRLRQKRQVKLG